MTYSALVAHLPKSWGCAMSLGSTMDLVSVLKAILLWTAIWLALSIPAWIMLHVLTGFGLADIPSRAMSLVRRLGFNAGLDSFFKRASEAVNVGGGSVRIYFDQKMRRLRAAITSSEQAVRLACQSIDDLTHDGGPSPMMDQIRALQQDTRRSASSLGGELSDEIEEEYASRGKSLLNVCILAVSLVVLIVLNGALLSLFFDGLIPGQVFGVKYSLIAGMAVVFIEVILGYSLADSASDAKSGSGDAEGDRWGERFLIAGIVGAAVFEAIVLGMVSHDFDLENELLIQFPILTYWMGIVGVVFVIGSSSAGLRFHKHLDRYMSLKGALRLKRELEMVNAYTERLPSAWGGVSKAAHQAEHAVQNYLQALGGGAGVLSGTVDRLRQERDGLIGAFRDARVDQWPEVLEARPADLRWAALQNVGLFIFTIAGLPAYGAAVAFFCTAAFGAVLPVQASWALAGIATLALYAIGFMPFGRVQMGLGEHGRVFPLLPGRLEYAVSGLAALMLSVGLLWLTTRVLGGWGALAGMLLIASGAFVAWAGYFSERAVAGAALLITLMLALVAAVLVGAFSVVRTVGLVIAAAFVWLLNVALSILAAPVTMVIRALRDLREQRSKAPDTPQATSTDAGAAA